MSRRTVNATALVVILVAVAAAGWLLWPQPQPPAAGPEPAVTVIVEAGRWPNVADHWADAQAAGHPKVCTIDREGAEDNRGESLAGIPTRDGYDRDEYPAAVCAEGGAGASVRHVPSAENRSHGSWWGDQLARWPDGTRVRIEVRTR